MKYKIENLIKNRFLVFLIFYLVIYCFFSLNGSYVIANWGGSDWSRSWVPKYCGGSYPSKGTGRSKATFTPLTFIYFPLIIIDQKFIHLSKDPFENIEE